MAADDPSSASRPPVRARRWSRSPTPPPNNSNRTLFRLIAIPALAVAGVLIYRGLQDRFTLPDCDSSRAKSTLDQLLGQLKLGPLQEGAIKTISADKQQVACNAVVQKPDGGSAAITYTFFWSGSAVDMRYTISLKPAQQPTPAPAPAPPPEAPVR
jgi:hypothetical protein